MEENLNYFIYNKFKMGCVASSNNQRISIRIAPRKHIIINLRKQPTRKSIYRFISLDLSQNILYTKRIQQNNNKIAA